MSLNDFAECFARNRFHIDNSIISIPAAPEWYQIRASGVGRKVELSCQQIIRAIFIFLTPPSTVNSQQSTSSDGAAGIDINCSDCLQPKFPAFRIWKVKKRCCKLADDLIVFYQAVLKLSSLYRINLKDRMRSQNQPSTSHLCTTASSFQQSAASELLYGTFIVFFLESD